MSNQTLNNQFEDKQLEELAQVLVASTPYAPPPSSHFTAELRQRLMAIYDEPVGWQFSWLPSLYKTAVALAAFMLIIAAGWVYLNTLPLPEPEPLAEPTVVQATVAPEPTPTIAATAGQTSEGIPIVGGVDSVDSVGITAVFPTTDILTQTTTFTVSVRYELNSADNAYIGLKLVEEVGMGGRGLYSQQIPITASSGLVTGTLIFRPGDVSGPTTIRLRAEIKTDPRAIPLAITMPHNNRWPYQPAADS
jgi:hypothetical protein